MPLLELTDRFCQTAKPDPGQRQSDFYDTPPNKGLILRVSATDKSWSFIFQIPGGTKGERGRLSLGAYPVVGLAKARTMAREAKSYLAEGRDPRAVVREQKAAGLTVAGLVENFMARYVRAEELRSADESERRLRLNVLPVIGDVKLVDLHKRDINRVIDPIIDRGAKTEAGRVYEDLRAMLRWATRRGDLDRCPMEGMQKPEGGKAGTRALDDAENQGVLGAAA